MRRTIMYYPSIEIPDGNWLRKALLYWDEISSIVPREMERGLYLNSRIIANLKEEGEYRPFYPDELMNSPCYCAFEKEVINKVKAYIRKNRREELHQRTFGAAVHKEKLGNYYGIHEDKMSLRIMEFLKDQGLVTSKGSWVNFHNQLAQIYMPTLAKYSALNDIDYTVVGTDQIQQIDKVYPIRFASKQPRSSRIPVFNLSLNVLPTPTEDVPYEDIIRFKRKYREELLVFRKLITDFETQVSNSESDYELKETIINFKESVELGVKETIRMFKGSSIRYFLSSLKSVISLKSPTLIATCAGLAGHNLLDIHPAIALSGIGVTGVIDVSVNYLAINQSTREYLSDKGFLYLYYANRKGIVNELS